MKQVLTTAALCATVIVLLKLVILVVSVFCRNEMLTEVSFGLLLTTEADLLYFSTALMAAQPLYGTLCLVLLTPITVSCLFYASLFAPVCTSRPRLAYPVIAIAPVLAHLLLVFSLWSMPQQMTIFVLQIPVHLIACWSYQKTDTIWTLILTHMLSNMVFALLMWGLGFI